MPIPTGGAWPPLHIAPAYEAYRDWDAWYVGDADKLRAVYDGRGGLEQQPRRVRASQYAGGLVGRFSRWMWGSPASANTRDARLHVPLPADLAATAANLLFSEPPKITYEEPSLQARIEELIEDGLNASCLHMAESGSVLGDTYLRPVIDEPVFGRRAVMTVVQADGAVPTIRWGKLCEVTFWQELSCDGSVHIRLLEHHDVVNGVGRITYALHQGTSTDLGRAVPFAEHPDAAYLSEVVDAEGAQYTGLKRLDVVRIPNAGPQRRWRTRAGLKYLGRSDFDGNEPIFDQIDEVMSSWMRDIRNAKGRITVPEYMLQSNGAGAGAVWDPDREIYSALTMLPDMTGPGTGLTISQFQIRHVEHKATGDALTEIAMRHAGLSSQTLGDEGDVAMTATEAQARERMSFTTRGNRIQGSYRRGLGDYIELHLELEAVRFGDPAPAGPPNIEFSDSVSESPEAVARTAQLLSAASAASIKTLVEMVHPDWDKAQVTAEVKLIEGGKQPIVIPNPDTFTGDTPPADPTQGGQYPDGELPPVT